MESRGAGPGAPGTGGTGGARHRGTLRDVGPPSPRAAEAGGHAGTSPGEKALSLRDGEHQPVPGSLPGFPRRFTVWAHRYGPHPGQGWARRLRSPSGRAGLGSPETAFIPLAKQLEIGMAKQSSAPPLPGRRRSPPLPVVMPGAVAQHLLPPPGRRSPPRPSAVGGGGETHSSPAPAFMYQHQHSPRRAVPRATPAPAATHRAGGPHSTTATPGVPPRPAAPQQHAQGNPISRQPT